MSISSLPKLIYGAALLSSVPASAHELESVGKTSAIDESAIGLDIAITPTPTDRSKAKSRWQIDVSPYVWVTGMQGRVAPLPGIPPVDVNMSFNDVVKDLSFGVIGSVAARRDRLSIFADVYYARIKTSESFPNSSLFTEANVLNETFSGMIAAGYILTPPGDISVQAMAGVRAWSMETRVDVQSKIPALSIKEAAREAWLDPVIGTQVDIRLAPKWSAGIGVAVGGFGIGSDFAWGVHAAASYQMSDHWRLGLGYRHLAVDYRGRDGFLFDASLSGMVIGANYRF